MIEKGIARLRDNGSSGTDILDKGVNYEYEYDGYDLYVNGLYIAGAYTHFWEKTKGKKVRKGSKQLGQKVSNDFDVVSIDEENKVVKLVATVTNFTAFVKYDEYREFIVEVNDSQLARIKKADIEERKLKLKLQKVWRKTISNLTLTYRITR